MDKTLPANRDAETAILGSIFLANEAFFQTDKLTADDFSLEANQKIYRAMLDLMEDAKPIDFVTVTGVLGNDLTAVGGHSYVTCLTDGLPKVKNISHYVDMVLDCSRRRKLIYLAGNMLNAAYEPDCKPSDLVVKFDRRLLEIETKQKSEPKRLRDVLSEADRQIDEDSKVESSRDAVGCRTGLKPLDLMTTGYRRREVTVIAGDTSDGKSTLARQGIIANGFDGRRQLVFSREVSRERLVLDLKTFISGVYAEHIRDPRKMNLLERAKFQEANKTLREWPLWIDDSRELTISELFHKARKLIRIEGVEIVWIDYMQLVKGQGSNKTEQTESVCSGVWTLADTENIPVVALSQLNRSDDAKGKKVRPTLRRLKNASQIEQDAHTLIFCYQPEDPDGNRVQEKSEIIIAKQRHGATGMIPVEFSREELIFKER